MDLKLVDIPLDRPGFDRFFGTWAVRGDLNVLVDAGPSRSVETLIDRLRGLGLNRVDYVLLTHIHLDHAGGLARLLETFPGALAVCHRKAVPHLVNPERLWAGSRKVLGDLADAYGAPKPVPREALIPHDLARIPGLRVVETPGHAPHHISFSLEGCLFAGEAGGNYMDLGEREVLRPATPPRFLLEESLASVDRLLELEDQTLCYAHFGGTRGSRRMLRRFREQLLRWRDLLSPLLRSHPNAGVAPCLELLLESDPELKHHPDLERDVRERERFFLGNSVRGYLGYLRETLRPAV